MQFEDKIMRDNDLHDYISGRLKNTAVPYKFNKEDVVNIFKLEKMFGQKSKSKQHHNPSEVGDCVRALYYKWKGVPVQQSPDDIESMDEAFAIGIKCHTIFTELLKQIMGIVVEEWVENKELNILGRMDFRWSINNMWFPVEIKTTGDNSYKYSIEKSNISFGHYCQLQAYLFMQSITFPMGHLLYINKESCYDDNIRELEWTIFRVQKDIACWNYIKSKINTLEDCLVKNVSPPIPNIEEEHIRCEWCQFKEACNKDEMRV